MELGERVFAVKEDCPIIRHGVITKIETTWSSDTNEVVEVYTVLYDDKRPFELLELNGEYKRYELFWDENQAVAWANYLRREV